MTRMFLFLLWACLLAAGAGVAQTDRTQSIADLRADMASLSADIAALRAELAAGGTASREVVGAGLPATVRLDQMEADLRRLTGDVERLGNDIAMIIDDGTKRLGVMEFRLTELEGGDTSQVAPPAPLGGDTSVLRPRPRPAPDLSGQPAAPAADPGLGSVASLVPPEAPAQAELAVSERADYEAAEAAFQAGDYSSAAEKFRSFATDFSGGPLTDDALFFLGESLAEQGSWNDAARSYLDSFSAAPSGNRAPEALYRLGVSLGKLGQIETACQTLREVERRYPGISPQLSGRVTDEQVALSCS